MFFVLFFASQCFAQAPFIDNKLSFGTSILKYIDPYKGTLVNAGIDVKIYDRISWYSELGFFTPSLFGFNPTPNNRGFAVVQELKIFQDSKTKCSGSYLAASIFYSNQFYNRTDSIYPTSAPPTEKQYDLHRQVVAATFSIGELMTFENGLNINFYVGAGGLINIVQNSLTEQEQTDIDYNVDWDSPNGYIHKKGTSILPKFTMGIVMSFRVKD